MPASKKPAKTTKTAHVLNVITGGQDSGEPAAEDTAASQQPAPIPAPIPAPAPAPAPPAPVVEVASADEDLSGRIMDALTEELGETPPEPAPIPQPVPPAPVVVQPAVIPDFSGEPDPSAPPPSPRPAEPPKPAQAAPQTAPPSEYINIVQALVEEKAPKYLEMLGVCKCSRCVADVKALTLSNLPPKYIVVHKSQRIPMLTVYEGKYNAAITAQLLSACKTVIENPRH